MSKNSTSLSRRNDFWTLTNSVFDDWFSEMASSFNIVPSILDVNKSKFAYPRVNIIDTEKEVIVEASVPGLTKDDIKVEWKEDTLTISGNKRESKEVNGKTFRREITERSFSRSFSVDEAKFDCYNMNAKVDNGLLTIKIPKIVQKECPKKIHKVEIK